MRTRLLCALVLLAALPAVAPRASAVPRDGGSITIAQTSQPDHLDPALSYTINGWEPMWLVYTPLLTYRHAEGTAGSEIIPGLAEARPTVSPDGRTYSLRLRPGLAYSDGRPVRASDFEHAIKRVIHLGSAGASFYLGIVGAEQYARRRGPDGDIAGIATDDASGAIAITLRRRDATFEHVLAMLFAAPVPGDTPFRDMTLAPPPGVGAYKITRSVPDREFVMERNALFALPGIPRGHVDSITTRIVPSAHQQTRGVIDGGLDYMQDPPPPELRDDVVSRHGDRFEEHETMSTYFMFMNHRVPPFDDRRVRQAVNFGVDKRRLARVFRSVLTPGCSFLPPGMPGYDERLDRSRCPWGNPARRPNLARARRLIARAGARGARVTVWGNSDRPTDEVTRAYARELRRIGLRPRVRIVPAARYFQTVGDRRRRAQTGFANWFADLGHPANFLFLVDGRSIRPRNNQNLGNVDDSTLNRGMQRLRAEPALTPPVVQGWARLNRTLVARGHVLAYGHRRASTFMSERMNIAECSLFHPLYGNDYSSFCLK